MELFDKVKRKFAKSAFIALAALMVGCGRNTDDVMENISGAVTGLENGDTTNVENATNTAEKYIDEIIKKAEKEGNTEERYKAEYMRLLNYSIENLSEAQKGLVGLQSAESTGTFSTIQDARVQNITSDSKNTIKIELAEELSRNVLTDYIYTIANFNTTTDLIKIAEECTINDSTYKTALEGVKSGRQIISSSLFDKLDGYNTKIQKIFDLSADEMKILLDMHAEPGYNSNDFEKDIQASVEAIVEKSFNPEKEKEDTKSENDNENENENDSDTKSSNESKGSNDSIIQRRLNEIKDKWNIALATFESKINNRIAEITTNVGEKVGEFKETTVDNAKLLEEQARIGAELRAKQTEQNGWEIRTKTGGPKEKVEARKNADQLQDEIDELQKRFDAISSAEDYTAYIKWLEENGYEVPEDEKEPSNEGIGEEVVEMSEEEWLEANGYVKGDGKLPEIEVGN